MPQIIKTYKQDVPASRFIGKKYGDRDRVNGTFGEKWGDWFSNNWFETIEKQSSENFEEEYADSGAYIGLMRHNEGEPFEYHIGIFMPESTPVPEGFEYIDFPKTSLGVAWVYGNEAEVYFYEGESANELGKAGIKIKNDEHGACWFFERYQCPRFTTPDENGKVILDICFFAE